jgi:hypothetical protein
MLALVLTVILGAVAVTVDISHIYNIHGELQTAADAAVLGGALALPNTDQAVAVAYSLGHLNHADHGTVVKPSDIRLGNWSDDRVFTENGTPINAVKVITRRAQSNANPVPLTFASIFGYDQADVSAFAIAKRDSRFGGIDTKKPCGDIIPLTVDIDDYNAQLALGNDQYAYHEQAGNVSAGSDGYPEIVAYPDKYAPGNYGLLNIGPHSLSTVEVAAQIQNGVSADDFTQSLGTSELLFYDENGSPSGYDINGNTGFKSTLESDFLARIGDIVAIFVHDSAILSGSTTVYHVIGIRFGRIMEARLQSGNKTRGVWFQPVEYECDGVIINPNVPPTEEIGKVVLVR